MQNNNFFTKNKFDKNNLPFCSFVLATYNRCPYRNFFNNPLTWACLSLKDNTTQLKEIVIIDDCSDDYTSQNVQWLQKKVLINIRYYRNAKHEGLSNCRAKGLLLCRHRLVFMGDDDCLFSSNFIIGGLISYKYITSSRKNVAILNLPVYERKLTAVTAITKNKIGTMHINQTFFYHNFDKYPKEYIDRPLFIKNTDILLPFKIDICGGVNLCNKNMIIKSGNYPNLTFWDNSYSEHLELSYTLKKNKYVIYQQADPRISACHLKYGANSKDEINVKEQNISIPFMKNYKLQNIINSSKKFNPKTGCRCTNRNFHINEIGSFFSFYLKISKKLGIKFAIKEYNNFVQKKVVYSTTPPGVIQSKQARMLIWKKAIDLGCKSAQLATRKNYTEINNYLTEGKWKNLTI